MIFRFFNFDRSRGQGVHNNNNNNGHFPEGGENQEIQQWRQSAPGQGVQETQTWMLWEKVKEGSKISLCTSVALRAAEPDLPLKLKRGPNKGRGPTTDQNHLYGPRG